MKTVTSLSSCPAPSHPTHSCLRLRGEMLVRQALALSALLLPSLRQFASPLPCLSFCISEMGIRREPPLSHSCLCLTSERLPTKQLLGASRTCPCPFPPLYPSPNSSLQAWPTAAPAWMPAQPPRAPFLLQESFLLALGPRSQLPGGKAPCWTHSGPE